MYHDSPADLTVPAGGDYPVGMMARFRGLYDMNPDVGGWIHIENTAVDYPIMMYGEGQYRNHNFNDEYSIYGQPYFGENTALSHRTLTVYGRNTGDGQMFSDLLHYRRVAFLQENSVIQMDTLYESARWQIFAVLVVDEDAPEECDYACSSFADDEAFAAYLSMLQQRSLFCCDREVTVKDRVLLLSVNAEEIYGDSSVRLVVAAYEMAESDTNATYEVNPTVKLPQVLTEETTTTRRPTPTTTSSATTQTTTQSSSVTRESTTVLPSEDTTTLPTEGSSTVDADATAGTTSSSTTEDGGEDSTTQSTTQEDTDDYTGN